MRVKAEEVKKEKYSLNDDRRVKVLSPGMLVAKRFIRNSLAVTGLSVLIFMFLFSYLGGLISPYAEDEKFYRDDVMRTDVAGAMENTDFRSYRTEGFSETAASKALLATIRKEDSFEYEGVTYRISAVGDAFYDISKDGTPVGCLYKDIMTLEDGTDPKTNFAFAYAATRAYASKETSFTADGKTYVLTADGDMSLDGQPVGYLSRYIVNPIAADVVFSRALKEGIQEFLSTHEFVRDGEVEKEEYHFVDENGSEQIYMFSFNAAKNMWNVKQATYEHVFDTHSFPSKEHWLGTDANGHDVLTRLMYGGRVSLRIGFIVVIIETTLGVIMGGISGYFGKWVDNLIMRIVDIFYCIPSTPIFIILGSAMDHMGPGGAGLDDQTRMRVLMLILGFFGWPGIARLVRGQILSLREQEFMTATEACGVRVSRRIFRHLIPNVIPQLIVTCTMSLGSTILTEATLSFLGLGVRYPFASWGNIINEVNDTYVLTTFWFVWIPAGVCLLATVLAFNLVGDGLRDAFDPKMKR